MGDRDDEEVEARPAVAPELPEEVRVHVEQQLQREDAGERRGQAMPAPGHLARASHRADELSIVGVGEKV